MGSRPLPTTATLILAALCDGPLHPYAIVKRIQHQTDHAAPLRASTLYRLIDQLLDSGCLREVDSRLPAGQDDERRRYFQITAAGRRALEAEARRLRLVLQATEAGLALWRSRA
jgi:DNA-binding PadR family transcriptional regulator